jgi:hypothetical protein
VGDDHYAACPKVGQASPDPAWVAGVDRAERRASFDKLRMRTNLRATKVLPHSELVEGRTMVAPVDV